MMMGTADEIVKVPEKGPVFLEDLPEEEQVVAVVRFLTFFLYIKSRFSQLSLCISCLFVTFDTLLGLIKKFAWMIQASEFSIS